MSILPLQKNVVIAIVLTGFALVSVTPPIDAFTISTNSQLGILEQVLTSNAMIVNGAIVPNNSLSEEDKSVITNGMQYLYDVKETDKVQGVSADFEMYNDFESTFGFSPYYKTVEAEAVGTSYWYSIDTSKPVDIGTYEYMITAYGNNYAGKSPEKSITAITDQGKQYEAEVISNGDQIDIQLRDEKGKVLLTSSVIDLINKVVLNNNAVSDGQLSPENMTFDVTGNGVSMRIIFQNMSKSENGTVINYDASMLLLFRFA